MPNIGDVRKKYYPSHNWRYETWTACPKCGKERWQSNGKRITRLCLQCANKEKNVKGENTPGWKGGRRLDAGYVWIYSPEHPFANSGSYVAEHRLIMEHKLGRYLTPNEVVHHINGIRSDNRIENLQLLSPSEHSPALNIACRNCPLRKEIRLLRWQIKELSEALQYKMRTDQ